MHSNKIILVDANDEIIGYEEKDISHNGEGLLHRAFSVFIFNSKNELLIQKRSSDKRLWNGFWSNTCCSHPCKDEVCEDAGVRRLKEELGIVTEIKFVYKFQYQANFKNIGSENEICYVYIGKYDGPVDIDESEIEEYRYISSNDLDLEIQENPENYTPWFKLEWERLRESIGVLLKEY